MSMHIGSGTYNNGHRAFFQALMARGTMTYEESKAVIASIWKADGRDEERCSADQVREVHFQDYINVAAQAASLYDYDVRSTVHQITKQRVYGLINTTSDPQTQLATVYSAEELSFIKRLLDAMFETYNTPRMEIMAITQMQAIKLARPLRRTQIDDEENDSQAPADKGLKHSEVEVVLASLVDGGWLERGRAKYYTLTPRALLELRPWLTETYNDPDAEPSEWQRIKNCAACKELITIGLRCSRPDCTFRIHDICADTFWRVRGGEQKCPNCSSGWTGKNYVGERAVTHTEAAQRARQRQSGGSGGRRESTQYTQSDPVDYDGKEEEESVEE